MGYGISLNLALSGVPFNGPDIGGFAGDTTPELLRKWMQACFLFPVCRNHTICESRRQEPWAFDESTLEVIRDYIRLRYRFRPYLYNLFVQQEETGEAILRPLMYAFADTPDCAYSEIADQFMIGPAIMQAPILEPDTYSRRVVLPPGDWYALHEGQWLSGGRTVEVELDPRRTPLYVRDGSIIPLAGEVVDDNTFRPEQVEFHLFARADQADAVRQAAYTHALDDGLTFAYKEGKRSRLEIHCAMHARQLDLRTTWLEKGYGECKADWIVYDAFDWIALDESLCEPWIGHVWTCAGTAIETRRYTGAS